MLGYAETYLILGKFRQVPVKQQVSQAQRRCEAPEVCLYPASDVTLTHYVRVICEIWGLELRSKLRSSLGLWTFPWAINPLLFVPPLYHRIAIWKQIVFQSTQGGGMQRMGWDSSYQLVHCVIKPISKQCNEDTALKVSHQDHKHIWNCSRLQTRTSALHRSSVFYFYYLIIQKEYILLK